MTFRCRGFIFTLIKRGCWMLKPNRLTRMVHHIEDEHLKVSKRGHKIHGSILDAIPQQLRKIRRLANGQKYHQTKLF